MPTALRGHVGHFVPSGIVFAKLGLTFLNSAQAYNHPDRACPLHAQPKAVDTAPMHQEACTELVLRLRGYFIDSGHGDRGWTSLQLALAHYLPRQGFSQ